MHPWAFEVAALRPRRPPPELTAPPNAHTHFTHFTPRLPPLQRDAQVEALRQELEQASSAYDACIAAFREKMRSSRIPEAEIGFPLASARDIVLGHR